MLEPAEGLLHLNVFTDSWRPLVSWPRNLWRPLDLAFRQLAKVLTQPWEQEGFLDWPFMGIDYRVWLLWREVEGVPTLTVQPFVPEAEED